MGSVSKLILALQVKENLTLPELLKKYPDLATLQYEEQLGEELKPESRKTRKKKKQLLCD